MCLRPAAPNNGVVFRRIDLEEPVELPAVATHVGDTRLSSCLEYAAYGADGAVRVGTVEHLMSALAALGVDNVWVDLDAPEVPIFDGSAAPFAYLLQSAGLEEQDAPKTFIRVKQSIVAEDGDKRASLEPYDGFKMDFSIAFDHPAIDESAQRADFDFGEQSYLHEIARARTFGFMQEVEWMRNNDLALGGNLGNAIVLDEFRVLNEDGLRYENEFVRHKLLDALGDLYLLGNPLLASFKAHKSGHALNNQLARALLQQEDKWEYVSFTEPEHYPAWAKNWPGTLPAAA